MACRLFPELRWLNLRPDARTATCANCIIFETHGKEAMRKHILLVLIIASLVLVACDGAIPETHIPPEAAASL